MPDLKSQAAQMKRARSKAVIAVSPDVKVRPAVFQVSEENEVRQAVTEESLEEFVRAEHEVSPEDVVLDGDELSLEDAEVISAPAPLSQEAQVKQLLSQALTMAKALGMVREEGGGAFVFTERSRQPRRDSSCTCEECTSYNQQHWYCIVCDSGPHDWVSDKPRHERLVLDIGGITGARHACCSDQCTRDYLASIRRPEPRVVGKQVLDPMLALP